uniref:G-protein coupled receptors family 1 profile domain-containing protein n=1 Tax=Seriola lalandi dorsalis TaxID=1841481 RepID=A0A3B4XP09_SERLL
MLQNNQLRSVPGETFNNLHNLQSLRLDANHISSVPIGCFSGLRSLRHLWLDDNSLTEVPVEALSDLPALQAMTLALNHISHVPDHAFSKLGRLVVLYDGGKQNFCSCFLFSGFHSNNIQSIPEHAFTGNPSLITMIDPQTLSLPQHVLHEILVYYYKSFYLREMRFYLCCSTVNNVDKFPAGPFRPCLHLLGSWLIRGGVWLIAVLSLVSNSLVVLSIFFSPATSVTLPKLLIGLLALVNGLMGVWCGWLAAVDAWTFGSFWRYGAKWESSFLCRLSGFLCVFASQTGLFLLTVAALERCLAAAIATTGRNKTDKHSGEELGRHASSPLFVRLSIVLCFLLGLAVTLPPLVAGHSSTSLCLPLPSSTSSSSLAFSVSLVLLDSLCFLLMTVAYTRLYCRVNKAPPASEEEAALTRHVAWLLFSDCLLYLPVAFLSFSSLLRLPAAGPEAAKGVLLLVAPLPACINPLLYLLFNPLAREELAALAKRTCGVMALPRLHMGGGGGGGGRGGGGRSMPVMMDSTYDEDAEKQSFYCISGTSTVRQRKARATFGNNGRRPYQHFYHLGSSLSHHPSPPTPAEITPLTVSVMIHPYHPPSVSLSLNP